MTTELCISHRSPVAVRVDEAKMHMKKYEKQSDTDFQPVSYFDTWVDQSR
jgi:hypothetical protein